MPQVLLSMLLAVLLLAAAPAQAQTSYGRRLQQAGTQRTLTAYGRRLSAQEERVGVFGRVQRLFGQ
jgi:hypothetical protein